METTKSCPIALETRPIPDPTTLTTQQLHQHTASVREVLESRIDAAEKVIDAIWSRIEKFDALVAKEIGHLKEVHGVKFDGIQTQFAERDTRQEKTSESDRVALGAALNAAKEAVGEQNKSSASAIAKSEAATTKQIDQIGVMNLATNKSTDEKIEDLKTSMATIKGQAKGLNDGWGYIVGIIGVLLALGTLIAVVLKK
jgi:hypothetical protein